jgi:hypothetical protein
MDSDGCRAMKESLHLPSHHNKADYPSVWDLHFFQNSSQCRLRYPPQNSAWAPDAICMVSAGWNRLHPAEIWTVECSFVQNDWSFDLQLESPAASRSPQHSLVLRDQGSPHSLFKYILLCFQAAYHISSLK